MFIKTFNVSLIIFCCLFYFNCDRNSNTSISDKITTDHHLTNSNAGQIVSLGDGDTFDITLQTIGPGKYETPSISNSVIQFLFDSTSSLLTPAGPTQVYVFRSNGLGEADITIAHSGDNNTFTLSCEVK